MKRETQKSQTKSPFPPRTRKGHVVPPCFAGTDRSCLWRGNGRSREGLLQAARWWPGRIGSALQTRKPRSADLSASVFQPGTLFAVNRVVRTLLALRLGAIAFCAKPLLQCTARAPLCQVSLDGCIACGVRHPHDGSQAQIVDGVPGARNRAAFTCLPRRLPANCAADTHR